jgi:glycosyltransferase involved in cell wall biosynthesis
MGRPLKISFFVDDLASNSIVRAIPLAEALQQEGYVVEIIGFLVSGQEVYAPYRDRFPFKAIQSRGTLPKKSSLLAELATGEIIYACKPLFSTFYPALLASSCGFRRPLLLDAEDNELWIKEESMIGGGLRRRLGWLRGRLKQYWRLRGTYSIQPFTRFAQEVTVVSRWLQRRYGGHIVLHGPNERVFDPTRPALARRQCRERFGFLADVPLVLFAGVPHNYKGLEMLLQALCDPRLAAMHLVLAGPPAHPNFSGAEASLPGRVRQLGFIANNEMPALVAACDVVPTPQIESDFTKAQVPAKLLEAMAMAKSVVASRVGDLPVILGETESRPSGWLHASGDVRGLADCLVEILRSPDEARRRSEAARTWFLQNASFAAMRNRLRPLIARCSARVKEANVAH